MLKREHHELGSETILVDNPIEGGTALWIASTFGYLDLVKELVSHGASIEHTTDSKSSPLHGAASYGQDGVCEFLIKHGATVDQPDELEQTPLTVAAIAQSKKCVELLLEKGANVNHKDNLGNTPLHAHVSYTYELKSVEIAKILIKAGAQNCANNLGYTPAILSSALYVKSSSIARYMRTAFHLDPKELCDYYCLNAAMDFLGCSVDTSQGDSRTWLLSACELRRANPDLLLSLERGDVIYDSIREPTSKDEVRQLEISRYHNQHNILRHYFLGLVICERILGRAHPMTATRIRYVACRFLRHSQFDKCMELFQRAIDFRSASVMPHGIKLLITDELVSAIYSFSVMVDHNYIPSVASHFQWGLRELTLTRERKMDIVGCLFRMIAVWIKVQECITDPERRDKETALISKAARELITSMDSLSHPVLMTCLQNIEHPVHFHVAELAEAYLPLDKALILFLDLGCSVHCEDEVGNFPLHLAVKLEEDMAPQCVTVLLEYGADIDAVNFDGKTALDVASEAQRTGVCTELEKWVSRYISLQCMAAKAVVKHFGGYYENLLPPHLVKFVSWHEGCTRHHAVTPFYKPTIVENNF